MGLPGFNPVSQTVIQGPTGLICDGCCTSTSASSLTSYSTSTPTSSSGVNCVYCGTGQTPYWIRVWLSLTGYTGCYGPSNNTYHVYPNIAGYFYVPQKGGDPCIWIGTYTYTGSCQYGGGACGGSPATLNTYNGIVIQVQITEPGGTSTVAGVVCLKLDVHPNNTCSKSIWSQSATYIGSCVPFNKTLVDTSYTAPYQCASNVKFPGTMIIDPT